MDFGIQKYISNLIKNQFPRFYEEEGETFILFVQAYYEWLESGYAIKKDINGNIISISADNYYALLAGDKKNGTNVAADYDLQLQPIHQARNLLDYRDIDNTLEAFLEHFQQKYLYGIPFNIIVDKRFLLKNVLDVYRSKGTKTAFKLLFKLIYGLDAEVYLPNKDILKASDGTWSQPLYLEITNTPYNNSLVGQVITGITSKSTAVVESIASQPINQSTVTRLFISKITPEGSSFLQGEKVLPLDQSANSTYIQNAPSVLGSVTGANVQYSSAGFTKGDIVGIAHRDINTNAIISSGIESKLIVDTLGVGNGSLTFSILNGGFGFTLSSNVFLYNNETDITGSNGNFTIQTLSNVKNLTYNTDLIIDYATTTIGAATFGFPANTSANSASAIGNTLSFASDNFGSILGLNITSVGSSYTSSPYIFVRSYLTPSTNLSGTISYSTSSKIITGTSTNFTTYFANGDIIFLQANSANNSTIEYQIIKTVTNSTSISLYNNTKFSSTASAKHRIAPVIINSNFTPNDPVLLSSSPTNVYGKNESVTGYPVVGNNIVKSLRILDSGQGYIDNEKVTLYKYNSLATPTVVNGGINYSNGDVISFIGGSDNEFTQAQGHVVTSNTGKIVSVIMDNSGSGYKFVPAIQINTNTGSGAILTTQILEFDSNKSIAANIKKTAVGKKPGYWSTTKGFLDSDKYVQDSYFYQDYSYQVKVGAVLDKYKSILYNTFHPAGTELFGKFAQIDQLSSLTNLIYEQNHPEYIPVRFITADNSTITADNSYYTVDGMPIYGLSADSSTIKADATLFTADQTTN
jgi:hypothetical protein